MQKITAVEAALLGHASRILAMRHKDIDPHVVTTWIRECGSVIDVDIDNLERRHGNLEFHIGNNPDNVVIVMIALAKIPLHKNDEAGDWIMTNGIVTAPGTKWYWTFNVNLRNGELKNLVEFENYPYSEIAIR